MRTLLRRLRSEADGESGFTILEVVVAMTIVAGAFTALAHASYGSMAALQTSRSRSVFIELANAELEDLRAMRFDALGVADDDPDLATAYPAGKFDGRDAVVVNAAALAAADPTLPAPVPAVEVRTQAPEGVRTPFTIRRWVTWADKDDTGSALSSNVKQIDLRFEWNDGRMDHDVTLHSFVYPGGLGPLGPDDPPVASVGAAPTTGAAPLEVTFDGTGSIDPEGIIDEYEWQFGDGATALGDETTHVYTAPGTYTAVLTVTDGSGHVHSASVDIDVIDPNAGLPPTASFTAAPTNGVAPLSVTFDGSGSTDPEGGTLQYRWEWGDGSPDGSGPGAVHQYTGVGAFTARLTVTDPTGLTASATIDVATTPLTCHITAASFKNPGTNATTNDIRLSSNNKPQQGSFTFTATTNAACSTVKASLPMQSGSLESTLTYTEAGGVRTWTGTASVGGSDRFNRANAQTGFFTGSDSASFPIAFNAHG